MAVSSVSSPTPLAKPLAFRKMHGLGNDFVVIDARLAPISLSPQILALLADRRLGIGCDQVIVLEKSETADVRMRIFNPDGGEVGACGNATRCIGWLIAQEKPIPTSEVTIETKAGLLRAQLRDFGYVAVDMGLPVLEWGKIPLSPVFKPQADGSTLRVACDFSHLDTRLPQWFCAVNMGNPHAVFFVEDNSVFDLQTIGSSLEHHAIFPERANISLVSKLGDHSFSVRVWERGAGLTFACGTAACAVAVAAWRLEFAQKNVQIELPGGALSIERGENNHVIMVGAIASSFSGEIDPSLLANFS